jgi:predicted lipoprotein with Yx(FWY)xxD motif
MSARPLTTRSRRFVGPLLAVGLLAAACGNSAHAGSPSSSSTGGAITLEAHQGSVGTYLTDQRGFALYLFTSDSSTTSSCSGACLSAWPPLTGTAKAGSGVSGADVSTITTAGGTKQVTFDGHPLYYFAGDTKAGQTNGEGNQGFGAPWWLVTPQGQALTTSGQARASSSSSGEGGYG